VDYDDVFEVLLEVCPTHGCLPDVPIESEAFFRELVSRYSGPAEAFRNWLEEQLTLFFRFMVKPPNWIQDPEWPLFQGRPMIFIGQIDLPLGSTSILNHTASYYVFMDYETGCTQVVSQAD
jgi:hypothetical protein